MRFTNLILAIRYFARKQLVNLWKILHTLDENICDLVKLIGKYCISIILTPKTIAFIIWTIALQYPSIDCNELTVSNYATNKSDILNSYTPPPLSPTASGKWGVFVAVVADFVRLWWVYSYLCWLRSGWLCTMGAANGIVSKLMSKEMTAEKQEYIEKLVDIFR